jgi:hypothetical protein
MPAKSDFRRAVDAVLPHAEDVVYFTPYMVVAGGRDTVAAATWAPRMPSAPIRALDVGAAKTLAEPLEVQHDREAGFQMGKLLNYIPRRTDGRPINELPLRLDHLQRFSRGLPTGPGIVRLWAGGTSLRFARPVRVEYEDWFVGVIRGEVLR